MDNNIYLHFHIGYSGKTNRPNLVTFQGVRPLSEVVSMHSNELMMLGDDLIDSNGHIVCHNPREKGTGTLDIATYNKEIVISFEDLIGADWAASYREVFREYLAKGGRNHVAIAEKYLKMFDKRCE